MKACRFLIVIFFLGRLAVAAPFSHLTDLRDLPISNLATKPKLLLVFWATWCQECRTKLQKELPALDNSADVSVVTINTDGDPSRAVDFVSKAGITLPVLRDGSGEVRKELKVFSVPHWAVYERGPSPGTWTLVESKPAFDWKQVMKALRKG